MVTWQSGKWKSLLLLLHINETNCWNFNGFLLQFISAGRRRRRENRQVMNKSQILYINSCLTKTTFKGHLLNWDIYISLWLKFDSFKMKINKTTESMPGISDGSDQRKSSSLCRRRRWIEILQMAVHHYEVKCLAQLAWLFFPLNRDVCASERSEDTICCREAFHDFFFFFSR